jgi:iron complex outermembrane receptor protein
MRWNFKTYIAAAAPLMAILGTCPALAAAPESAAGEAASGTLIEDIVVTARRTDERAQTVPVSLIALSTQDLAERQVKTVGDLTNQTPGLRFVAQGGSGNQNVVLRGLARAPTGDSPGAVTLYFGDIPIYFLGSDIATYDLQNIQVLKGPQGTLFGRNSIGGAILMTPAKPTYEFGGYINGSVGNLNYKDADYAVNLPIVKDKVALRISGKISRRDGFVDVINFPGTAFDDIHRDSIRGSLLIEPTTWLRNITVADYSQIRETGTNSILYKALPTGLTRSIPAFFSCHTAGPTNPFPCTGFQPNRDIDDALAQQQALGIGKVVTGRLPFQHRTLWGIQNRTEVSLNDNVQLRGIVGYRSLEGRNHGETQGSGFSSPPLLITDGLSSLAQVSAEGQVVANLFDNRVSLIGGGFYITEKPDRDQALRIFAATLTPAWSHSYNNRESDAVFGQVGIKLDELLTGLKFNAGGRYTWDKASLCSFSSPFITGYTDYKRSVCVAQPNVALLSYKSNSPTYNVGFDWQVNHNIFAYVTHRRGYRAGGINTPRFVSPQTVPLRPYQTFGSEKVLDYEAGVKTDFNVADWGVRFNLAVYRTDYSNVQTNVNTNGVVGTPAPADSSGSIIVNTGARRFTGVEGDLVLRPTSTLSFGGNVAYIHQKVTDPGAAVIPGLVLPAIVNVSPKWAYTLHGRWELPFRPAGGPLVVSADYYKQTSFAIGNDVLPGYDNTNARLEWNDIGGGPISTALFVRNAFNDRYLIAVGATASALGFFAGQYNEPRVYGLELKVRLGE